MLNFGASKPRVGGGPGPPGPPPGSAPVRSDAVADPAFSPGVRQLPKVLLFFMHENERIWTPGGRGHASLAPPLNPPMRWFGNLKRWPGIKIRLPWINQFGPIWFAPSTLGFVTRLRKTDPPLLTMFWHSQLSCSLRLPVADLGFFGIGTVLSSAIFQ